MDQHGILRHWTIFGPINHIWMNNIYLKCTHVRSGMFQIATDRLVNVLERTTFKAVIEAIILSYYLLHNQREYIVV